MRIGSTPARTYDPCDLKLFAQVAWLLDLLGQAAGQIALAVENALAYRQIEELKNKLAEEKSYPEDEIRTEYQFSEIIGSSAAIKHVLRQVEVVAPADGTVPIQGETGTGKELVARALHNLSTRKERTLIKLTLPEETLPRDRS